MMYITPLTCVVTNVMGHVQDNKSAIRSVTSLREELRDMGYLVHKVTPVYKRREFQGVVLIEFGNTHGQITTAVKLQAKFEAEDKGWINWDRSACLTGCFLWLANKDDARHFMHPAIQDYDYIPENFVVEGNRLAKEDNRDVVRTIEQYFENLYN